MKSTYCKLISILFVIAFTNSLVCMKSIQETLSHLPFVRVGDYNHTETFNPENGAIYPITEISNFTSNRYTLVPTDTFYLVEDATVAATGHCYPCTAVLLTDGSRSILAHISWRINHQNAAKMLRKSFSGTVNKALFFSYLMSNAEYNFKPRDTQKSPKELHNNISQQDNMLALVNAFKNECSLQQDQIIVDLLNVDMVKKIWYVGTDNNGSVYQIDCDVAQELIQPINITFSGLNSQLANILPREYNTYDLKQIK